MNKNILLPLVALLNLILLAGCGDETVRVATAPRSVKVERIDAAGSPRIETFTGTVRATQRAELGFESGGRIATLAVDVGDSVRAGKILATVDQVPAKERLRKAEADRNALAASLAEKEAQLQRTRQLERDEVVSGAVLDDARLQRDAAAAQLEAADAGLALARRELAMSSLAAPFDGRIVARNVQPTMNVAPGQTVLEIEGGGAREVVAFLPGKQAERLKTGNRAIIGETGNSTSNPGKMQRTSVRLTGLSGHADHGSLVQAVFQAEGDAHRLRPGASVMLELPGDANDEMTIPASALLPDAQSGHGAVFVFDAARERVVVRKVRIGNGLAPEGRLPVAEGLVPGELVVVAGSAFLSDGQPAKAFESQTLLSDARR